MLDVQFARVELDKVGADLILEFVDQVFHALDLAITLRAEFPDQLRRRAEGAGRHRGHVVDGQAALLQRKLGMLEKTLVKAGKGGVVALLAFADTDQLFG